MRYSILELREIFHLVFLEHLLRRTDPKLYILKGGVNLRFFLGSPRYSEDMDLDVLGGAVTTLKKNGYKILSDSSFLRSLRTYGISQVLPNDPSKAKHTETTQRFRVRLELDSGESLPTKVEFSRREPKNSDYLIELMPSEIAMRYHRIGFMVQHYSGKVAAIQKVLALGSRSVSQARDVFDLDLLMRSGMINSRLLQAECRIEDMAGARTALSRLKFEDYLGQVVEYLEDQYRKEFERKEYWEQMVNRVTQVLTNG